MRRLIVFCIYFSELAFATDVSDPGTFSKESLHPNVGCPINSICSKSMGMRIADWESTLAKVTEKTKVKILKSYLKDKGIPLEFLSKKTTKESLDPVMWNSRCKLHNPRNPNKNIYKSIQFLKSIPDNKDMVFKKLNLYDEGEILSYNIPQNSYPVLIQNNKLIMTEDYDDTYYQLGVSPEGKVSIENFPYSLIKNALNKNVKDTKCPDKMEFDNDYFVKTYCHKIYDIDTDKLKTIQVAWSCP